jgi:uncharacterized protein (UPF0297 family)
MAIKSRCLVVFKRLSKIVALFLILSLTVGCATKLAPKADKQKQEEVKQEVLNLLEKEYNQPFKIVGYSYSYDTHYPAGNCSGDTCKVRKFGTYKFKIQAVNNSIIVLNLKIMDYSFDKYANGLDYFKSSRLAKIYCSSFGDYWKNHKGDKNNNMLEKNIRYCNDRGQKGEYDNILTQ